MTRNEKRWTELAELRAPLDAIIADDSLRDLALAAIEEAYSLALGALGGSSEPKNGVGELLSIVKAFVRSAEDAKGPLVLEALGIGSCLSADDWAALSSCDEAAATPSMEAVALFLSKTEDLLHARDGVPFTRPYLPQLKAVSREELCADELAAKALTFYPDSVPPVVVSLADYRSVMEEMISDRFGSLDPGSRKYIGLRRFFEASVYDVESEEGALVFVGWEVAEAMYSKSESAFAAKWRWGNCHSS